MLAPGHSVAGLVLETAYVHGRQEDSVRFKGPPPETIEAEAPNYEEWAELIEAIVE